MPLNFQAASAFFRLGLAGFLLLLMAMCQGSMAGALVTELQSGAPTSSATLAV